MATSGLMVTVLVVTVLAWLESILLFKELLNLDPFLLIGEETQV